MEKENGFIWKEKNKICKLTYEKIELEKEKMLKFIAKKSVVLILCDNNIESMIGYLACYGSECIVMLLSDNTTKIELINIINTYKVNYVWGNIDKISIIGENVCYEYKKYGLLKCNMFFYNYSNEINDKNPKLLLTTSGSTGNSKFVMLSKKNCNINAKDIVDSLNIKKEDIAITTLPMWYTFGLSVINSHVLIGASIVITKESVCSPKFWELFDECNITSVAGVPYTYELLRKSGKLNNLPKSIRYMTQAGGAMSTELRQYIIDNMVDKDFFVMYGQTEATARISCMKLKNKNELKRYVNTDDYKYIKKRNLYSVGRCIGNEKAYINKSGNIQIEGENIFLGYAKNYEDIKNESHNCKKYLDTKDKGSIDEKGYIYITGRSDRIIKIRGLRINLDELENKLESEFVSVNFICVYSKNNKVCINYSENNEKYNKVSKMSIKKFICDNMSLDTRLIEIYYHSKLKFKINGKKDYNSYL